MGRSVHTLISCTPDKSIGISPVITPAVLLWTPAVRPCNLFTTGHVTVHAPNPVFVIYNFPVF